MSPPRAAVLIAGAVAFFAVACGTSSPGAEGTSVEAQPTGAASAEDMTAVDRMYARIEGLEPDERRAALIDMAREEEGPVSLYTSTGIDDISPVLDGLSEEAGVDTTLFRSGAREVFQRVLQEADAGRLGTDVILIGYEDMAVLEEEGLLMPLRSPFVADLVSDGQSESFAPVYLVVHVAAWNTDQIPPEAAPTSWEDLLSSPPGLMAFDQTDYAWFATLVQEHFMKEKGMTQDEAVQLFQSAMPEAMVMRGHSAGMELLLSGELPLHASQYLHTVRGNPEGAPVQWEPALEPLIYLAYSVGITQGTPRPASSLLLVDYLLAADEGQKILASVGRTPANTKVEAGGIPVEYESMGVPSEISLEDRDKWEQLWLDEVVPLVGDDRT